MRVCLCVWGVCDCGALKKKACVCVYVYLRVHVCDAYLPLKLALAPSNCKVASGRVN